MSHTIAQTIMSQIDKRVLMSLGSSDFGYFTGGPDNLGQLMFMARILPMTKTGRGTRARRMHVAITLEFSDTYSVKVTYSKGRFERVTHFEESGIYADQLDRLLLSLDYDGREVTNPRYWHAV